MNAEQPDSVSFSPEQPVIVGRVHRTLCDVEMIVYDYDRVESKLEILPAGSTFQP